MMLISRTQPSLLPLTQHDAVPRRIPVDPVATPVSTAPRSDLAAGMLDDVTEATRLVGRASEMLSSVPTTDTGSDATKDLRMRVFRTNLAAQSRIAHQIGAGNPSDVLSQLRRADASLEDANWQLATTSSPDGRFDGVDVPGAVRDTAEGARILGDLLHVAANSPTTSTAPGTTPPVEAQDPEPEATTAPTTPPPATSGGSESYPGEDEFPPIHNAG